MRKLIFLIGLFVILTSCSKEQIGWSSLTSSQWVSFTDAQGSGIYQKVPIMGGYNWMSKQAAMFYLDIDTSYLVGLPKNQWISKSLMIGNTYSSTNTLHYTFSVLPTGVDGQSMSISINGTQMVSRTASGSGSITVSNNDVVVISVTAADGSMGAGGDATAIISTGLNGFQYVNNSNGYSSTSTQTFTWIPQYGYLNVATYVRNSSTIYYNTAQYADAIKNNCSSGYAGSIESYTTPANTFTSTASQLEVDGRAYSYARNMAQAYANANGSCTAIPSGGSGCTNSLSVSYGPSPAQDYGDADAYLAYILINGYEVDTKTTYTTTIHDGDSLVIKIHMPPSTKGITGVNINYKDDSNKSLLQIAAVIVNSTAAGLGQALLGMFTNLLGFELAKGTTTNIHNETSDSYDIWIREKYSCDKGNIKMVINNMIDLY